MDLVLYEKLNKYKTDGKGYSNLSRRVRMNAVIADFYKLLGEENEDVVISRGGNDRSMYNAMLQRSRRVLACGRSVETLRFRDLGIHEVKRIKLCGDKFCGNCQKQLANARERKYTPLLKAMEKVFDIYHIVLTVPNVSDAVLPVTVYKIISSFGRLIKYISGRKRIRGLSFDGIGYVGAIRSLEITHNENQDTYHPHLHCVFASKKGLELDKPKVFTNRFSFNQGRKGNQFSAFEVFLQKLWNLVYSGNRVTKTAIEAAEGYSCIVNRADGNYHQIFKYVVKGLLDDKRAQQLKAKGSRNVGLTYEEFRALYFALEHCRAMQGYGCFYGLKFDDSILNVADGSELEVETIVKELQKECDGEFEHERLAYVIENIVKRGEIYFSRKSVQDSLSGLGDDD